MSTLEDRLTAALEARAELVRPEDLRPASPPPVVVPPLRRRPAVYLLAAAACAVIVSVPFLVKAGRRQRPRSAGRHPDRPGHAQRRQGERSRLAGGLQLQGLRRRR